MSSVQNVKVFFRHKVLSADFDQREIIVRDVGGSKEMTIDFDFCIGADGSYSIIRRQLMRVVRLVFRVQDA